jgi:hypothetical protein
MHNETQFPIGKVCKARGAKCKHNGENNIFKMVSNLGRAYYSKSVTQRGRKFKSGRQEGGRLSSPKFSLACGGC